MRSTRGTGRALLLALLAGASIGVAGPAFEAVAVARLPATAADLPIRLYARPPVIFVGQRLDAAAVRRHLERLGYEEVRERAVRPGEFASHRRDWIIAGRSIDRLGALGGGRTLRVRLDASGRVRTIEDHDGTRYRAVPLEPEVLAILSSGGRADRVPVRLETLPAHVIDAVLTVEDRRFRDHGGLDYRRIAAAALANLRDGRVVQGGSTITQQLAKNLFLDSRRTLVRKAREAAMALVLEARHSKDEILAAYLDEVYLGHAGGRPIRGIGRAAEVYFGKDASRLDLSEAATIAGLIRGPNLYSPRSSPDAARRRRDLVLRMMAEDGVIDRAAAEAASARPLHVRPSSSAPPPARYFTDYVRQVLATSAAGESSDADALAAGAVVTSLDPELQRAATAAVAEGVRALERRHPDLLARGETDSGPLQAALVALDPRSGDILAMVGGRDYGASQFNRATHGRRQPGSSFKPIVTLAAVAQDFDGSAAAAEAPPLTLATVLSDEPLEVDTPAGPWRPANYDGRHRGRVTLREALEGSLNVPFARLGLHLGPERIVRMARRVGIESPLRPYPSIALGAFEVTPLEMAGAYGTLAAGGVRAAARPILGTLSPAGELARIYEPSGRRTASAAEAWLVTSALLGAVERGTGRGLRSQGFYGAVAAKSGTTNGFRDGWFIGYTPALTVAVWVGFDDGRSLGLPGSRVALPIFARFLSSATGPYGDSGRWGSDGFSVPRDVEVVRVDPATGLRGGPGCPGRPEWFVRGTAPVDSCSPFVAGGRRWAGVEAFDALAGLRTLRERLGPRGRAESPTPPGRRGP